MKLAMLPNAICELMYWTWSPRLRRNFQRELGFEFVEHVVTRRPSYATHGEVVKILRKCASHTAPDTLPPPVDVAASVVPKFADHCSVIAKGMAAVPTAVGDPDAANPDDNTSGPSAEASAREPNLHAELAVLMAATAMVKKTPGFGACDYIGVSKLACLCCATFIDAYNKRYGTRWMSGGTHGKFYPWSFLPKHPHDVSCSAVLVDMLEKVTLEFAWRCQRSYVPPREFSDAGSDSGAEGGNKDTGGTFSRRVNWDNV
jgi:hypothetical protein